MKILILQEIRMSDLRKTLILAVLGFSSGCSISYYSPAMPSSNSYYRNPAKNISSLGKVALIELQNNSPYPQISEDVTEMVFQQMQKKQVFGLKTVQADSPEWKNLQIPPEGPENISQLAAIRKTLNCNAIIIGTVTEYQPYPHLSIGLRLKMIDLTDGQLIWGFEQIWDSADKSTQQKITKYLKQQKKGQSQNLDQQLISLSSIEFLKFVTYEMTRCCK